MRWAADNGTPTSLLSDHGGDFASELFEECCKLMNIKHLYSGSYHPQCNGSVERWNRTLGESLKCINIDRNLDFESHDDWSIYVPFVAAAHNNKFSPRIGMSPNEAHFGYRPRLPVDHETIIRRSQGIADRYNAELYRRYMLNAKMMAEKVAKLQLNEYDRKRKEYYDLQRKCALWKRGDKVLYYDGPKGSAAKMTGPFASKWKGPYRIISHFNDGQNWVIQLNRDSEPINVATECLRKYRDRNDEDESHRIEHKTFLENVLGEYDDDEPELLDPDDPFGHKYENADIWSPEPESRKNVFGKEKRDIQGNQDGQNLRNSKLEIDGTDPDVDIGDRSESERFDDDQPMTNVEKSDIDMRFHHSGRFPTHEHILHWHPNKMHKVLECDNCDEDVFSDVYHCDICGNYDICKECMRDHGEYYSTDSNDDDDILRESNTKGLGLDSQNVVGKRTTDKSDDQSDEIDIKSIQSRAHRGLSGRSKEIPKLSETIIQEDGSADESDSTGRGPIQTNVDATDSEQIPTQIGQNPMVPALEPMNTGTQLDEESGDAFEDIVEDEYHGNMVEDSDLRQNEETELQPESSQNVKINDTLTESENLDEQSPTVEYGPRRLSDISEESYPEDESDFEYSTTTTVALTRSNESSITSYEITPDVANPTTSNVILPNVVDQSTTNILDRRTDLENDRSSKKMKINRDRQQMNESQVPFEETLPNLKRTFENMEDVDPTNTNQMDLDQNRGVDEQSSKRRRLNMLRSRLRKLRRSERYYRNEIRRLES